VRLICFTLWNSAPSCISKKNALMKSCLYILLFLLSANSSFAQNPVADTSRLYIDKCKIRGASSLIGTTVKTLEVNPGGTPANQELKSPNDSIHIRGVRGDSTYFYIDGIKVRGSANLPKSAIEEVSIITGGLPVNYGDSYCGCIIRINCPPKNPAPTSDKEQKLATE
jgi:hypothetical protein